MRLWLTLAILFPAFAQTGSVPDDPAAVDAGKQIYMGSCSGCHGATGEGSQGPSLLSGRASRLPDQTLFNSIKNGLPGTSMPNFALPDEKVWQIAAFVRSLTSPAIAARPAGNAERGREIFFGEGRCSGCHMILGKGGYPGPDLSNIAAERTLHQIRESILKPSARVETGFRAAIAKLKSGRAIEGVAKNYNNYTVQILDKTGRLHRLQQSDIATLQILDDSMMPPVPEAQATDLIAFLARQSARPYEGASR